MSEGPSDPSKDATPRTAESFATWLSLFGVSPAGTPVSAKPVPAKSARKDRATSKGEDPASST